MEVLVQGQGKTYVKEVVGEKELTLPCLCVLLGPLGESDRPRHTGRVHQLTRFSLLRTLCRHAQNEYLASVWACRGQSSKHVKRTIKRWERLESLVLEVCSLDNTAPYLHAEGGEGVGLEVTWPSRMGISRPSLTSPVTMLPSEWKLSPPQNEFAITKHRRCSG